MSDPRRALVAFAARARRRIRFVRAVRVGLRTLLYVLIAGAAVVALWRTTGLGIPWHCSVSTGASLVLIAGALGYFFPRIGLIRAAAGADERGGWKEKISSALAVGVVDAPMEHALLADARERVRGARMTSLFPHEPPAEVRWLAAPAALMAACMLLPPLDLLGVDEKAEKERAERARIEKVVRQIEARKETLKKADPSEKPKRLLAEAVKELERIEEELIKEGADPIEALAKLNQAIERLKELQKELANARDLAERVQRALAKTGKEEGGELGEKLKQAKFDEAAKELERLQKRMEDGDLTESEKAETARRIENLQKALRNGNDLSKLEEALAKASQSLKNGLPEGLEDLKQMMQDMAGDQASREMMEEMLRSMEGMQKDLAEGMKDEEREELAKMLDKLVGGEGQCSQCGGEGGDGQGGACPGCGKPGHGGTGGEGHGRGGDPGETPTDTGLVRSKVEGQLQKGKVVGAWSIKGEPPKGEARVEFEDVAGAAATEALDSLSKQRVPATHRDYVREYFDAIRGKGAATPEK